MTILKIIFPNEIQNLKHTYLLHENIQFFEIQGQNNHIIEDIIIHFSFLFL